MLHNDVREGHEEAASVLPTKPAFAREEAAGLVSHPLRTGRFEPEKETGLSREGG